MDRKTVVTKYAVDRWDGRQHTWVLAEQLAPTEMGNSLRGSMGHRITIQVRGGRQIEKVYRYDV